jgi:hypothetical protein
MKAWLKKFSPDESKRSEEDSEKYVANSDAAINDVAASVAVAAPVPQVREFQKEKLQFQFVMNNLSS